MLRDEKVFMAMALDLAMMARDDVAPNPRVGAVVVRKGRVVGRGYHERPGLPHAEVLALREAGERARGATLYVNLEPCCHLNKRTPPCTREILSSGIGRVVISLSDPNPHVNGKGILELREGGVSVETGLLAPQAFAVNRGFLSLMKNGRPFVTLKGAASLDGQIATATGDSQWISGAPSLKYAHQLRQEHDAIVVGVGTVLKDNPLLTTRLPGLRKVHHPVRVILDSLGRTPPDSRLFETISESPVWIMAGEHAPEDRVARLEDKGARIFRLPAGPDGKGLRLSSLLAALLESRLLTLLVEGGAQVNGSFLQERLVDSIRLVLAPLLIGGEDALGWIGGRSPKRLVDAFRFPGPLRTRRLGEDLLISVDLWNETLFLEKNLSGASGKG
ncbi:bifunctional diaminohydroxyphosphoribosylaminopyrimidine deaminase/5-amino-6-(5-phosphoribosylamino)uracil reductase RibD [Leptospirillum ferriphilum]|uniref:Riboflavin biosynthesis protein RibD n=1 Tax=Leptospirillum ferriphilum TaxID=178606 RepID=A0A1V3ST55_9BACT|nr:bifunctional diaminohydroxyphosphoribosylaminopyrimidine deaminase/5-amino-6-(5-phosphoribosylamino)uracil reductase RibD [Leptospirillum ferriphilum]OOH70836.1 riboflavin biosynthesis protein RibD [Leptospirillum ferriphilum]